MSKSYNVCVTDKWLIDNPIEENMLVFNFKELISALTFSKDIMSNSDYSAEIIPIDEDGE